MKTLLKNGKIYLSENHFTDQVMMDNQYICAVGKTDIQPDAEIDLNGKTVLPGFNDCHMHLLSYGRMYVKLNLNDCTSSKNVIEKAKQYMKDNPSFVKHGLAGRGWNEDYFDVKTILTKQDMDEISTEVPVVLTRVCGHLAVANTIATRMMGYDDSHNGVFCEKECDLAKDLIPELENDVLSDCLYKAMKSALEVGITSVQCQDIEDYRKQKYILDLFEEVYQKHDDLPRYRFQCAFDSATDLKTTLENHEYKFKKEYEKLKLGPLKLYKDGSLGAKTALLWDGYIDNPQNHGIMVLTCDQMEEYVRIADHYNMQVVTHCIGDQASEETSEVYHKVNPENPNRNGLIHTQITTYQLLDKIKEYNIPVSYQPIFLEYDLHMVPNRVKPALERESYAFKYAIEKGIQVGFSTDCPIESFNPFYNIHCAVNRQDLNNQPAEGYQVHEKVSLTQAIDAYTSGSAYFEFAENEKGRIKEGYLADMVVLDTDIFTCPLQDIKNIKPVMTIVDGKIVYRNQK